MSTYCPGCESLMEALDTECEAHRLDVEAAEREIAVLQAQLREMVGVVDGLMRLVEPYWHRDTGEVTS